MTTLRNNWEKQAAPTEREQQLQKLSRRGNRTKFLVGGLIILAAVAYLIVSSTLAGARYFITVEELVTDSAYLGETVRISGAVLGETIDYDSENLTIEFVISHIPTEFDDLATALHQSVEDPMNMRVPVRIENEVKPDLLRHEAQAILTGYLDENGVFQANELLLKCPSRFEEAGPGEHAQIADEL